MKHITIDSHLVMGIVNITPDSFYKPSTIMQEDDILRTVETYINQGADIIDIGAQSTSPYSKPISAQEELQRIMLPLKKVRKHFPDILISIDTYYGDVAEQCIAEGANIINDIGAGNMDTSMLATITKYPKNDYILMHMQGNPSTMQNNPQYDHVVQEIYVFLEQKIQYLKSHKFYNITIDPGFGFGKTISHNYTILKQLSYFKQLDRPILVGMSRKRLVTQVLNINSEDALNSTTVLNTIALLQGANILRVHDVKEAKECIRIVQTYLE